MLEKDGLSQEVSIGVTYSSLMSAVALFFTGVVISQFNSFDQSIKVPLIFLIISTFSFIFSATIYTNASTEITVNKIKLVEKYLIYGKNLMEIMGLYPFILATPLVVGAVTNDSFIKVATTIIAIVGFTLYSQSKFSILQKELALYKKRLLTLIIVLLALVLYISQATKINDAAVIYVAASVLLMLIFTCMAYYFSKASKQYKRTFFRPFQTPDAELLSAIVISNLDKVKTTHYSGPTIEKLREHYSPKRLITLAQKKQIIVAEYGHDVAGMLCLDKNTISTVFTDQTLQGKGIGRMLVDYAEDEAIKHGFHETKVEASLIDHEFYKRLGYHDIDSSKEDDHFVMQKGLHYHQD